MDYIKSIGDCFTKNINIFHQFFVLPWTIASQLLLQSRAVCENEILYSLIFLFVQLSSLKKPCWKEVSSLGIFEVQARSSLKRSDFWLTNKYDVVIVIFGYFIPLSSSTFDYKNIDFWLWLTLFLLRDANTTFSVFVKIFFEKSLRMYFKTTSTHSVECKIVAKNIKHERVDRLNNILWTVSEPFNKEHFISLAFLPRFCSNCTFKLLTDAKLLSAVRILLNCNGLQKQIQNSISFNVSIFFLKSGLGSGSFFLQCRF